VGRKATSDEHAACLRHQIALLPADCGPSGLSDTRRAMDASEGQGLTYRMIAERDNETVKVERESCLVIVAKARIWASEGWEVVVTDADGKSYAPAEFDQLLAA
jgi:hypothetical protein